MLELKLNYVSISETGMCQAITHNYSEWAAIGVSVPSYETCISAVKIMFGEKQQVCWKSIGFFVSDRFTLLQT